MWFRPYFGCSNKLDHQLQWLISTEMLEQEAQVHQVDHTQLAEAGTAAVDTQVARTVVAAFRTAAEQDSLELDNLDSHSLLDKIAVDILLVAHIGLVVVHLSVK